MNQLHGNLNVLSEESFQILLNYYRSGSLSFQDQSLLQNEITKLKDTFKGVLLRD